MTFFPFGIWIIVFEDWVILWCHEKWISKTYPWRSFDVMARFYCELQGINAPSRREKVGRLYSSVLRLLLTLYIASWLMYRTKHDSNYSIQIPTFFQAWPGSSTKWILLFFLSSISNSIIFPFIPRLGFALLCCHPGSHCPYKKFSLHHLVSTEPVPSREIYPSPIKFFCHMKRAWILCGMVLRLY